MAARTPNLQNAAIELTFVVLASALGGAGAPIAALFGLIAVMVAYWLWSRRAALARMYADNVGALIRSSAFALVVLAGVLAGAFFVGRALHGWAVA